MMARCYSSSSSFAVAVAAVTMQQVTLEDILTRRGTSIIGEH
jgi:hypothetical protein